MNTTFYLSNRQIFVTSLLSDFQPIAYANGDKHLKYHSCLNAVYLSN